MVGLRYNLGPSYGILEPEYTEIPQPIPPQFQDEDGVALVEYVQFEINKSIIRSSEVNKIMRVVQYLHEHPQAHVELTGFADKLTGNASINQRLSVERAHAVSQFLSDRGISSDRISRYAKGDRVQPFQVNEDNRVTICIVIDEGLTEEVQQLRESIK
jgi:outer membrane protein OmpA-like peptidoglycan-associated protein